MDEAAARVIAKAAVQETFTALGVDVTTPAGIIETQQDFAWTRSVRLTARKLRMHVITAALTIAVPQRQRPNRRPRSIHPRKAKLDETNSVRARVALAVSR